MTITAAMTTATHQPKRRRKPQRYLLYAQDYDDLELVAIFTTVDLAKEYVRTRTNDTEWKDYSDKAGIWLHSRYYEIRSLPVDPVWQT